MKRFWMLVLIVFLAVATIAAQRSFTTTYDTTRKVTLEGVVTKIDWVNPRAFMFLNVRESSGTVANWAVEFGAPLELEKNGFTSGSLKVGDTVTVQASPARTQPHQAAATSVVLKSSGKRL